MNVNSAKQDLSSFSPSQDRLSSLGGILKEDWSTVFGKRSQKGLIFRHQGVMCTYISSPSVHRFPRPLPAPCPFGLRSDRKFRPAQLLSREQVQRRTYIHTYIGRRGNVHMGASVFCCSGTASGDPCQFFSFRLFISLGTACGDSVFCLSQTFVKVRAPPVATLLFHLISSHHFSGHHLWRPLSYHFIASFLWAPPWLLLLQSLASLL